MTIVPYKNSQSGKKQQVRAMFDNIAPKYDLLNHVLSFGIDRRWRARLVREVSRRSPSTILDVATGTGDLAMSLSRKTGARVIGADLSPEMLAVGRDKIRRAGLQIEMVECDAEQMPFQDGSFEAVTAAFGVRNFENLQAGLSEMYRVLTVGGNVYILEFSMPSNRLFGRLYRFYFHRILPLIGHMVSRDRQAYTYLPQSVEGSKYGDAFTAMLSAVGFRCVRAKELMFGIATLYTAEK